MELDPVNRVLVLQTDDPADEGLHDMLLCVTLANFQIEYCQPFAALVSDCEITGLQLAAADPPGSSIIYQVQESSPAFNIPLPVATYAPTECVYDLIYTVFPFNSENDPLPDFLTFSSESGLKIQSGNPLDAGTY